MSGIGMPTSQAHNFAIDGKCLFASIMVGLFLLSYQCTAVLGASTYHHVRLQYPSTWNFLLYS